MNEITKKYYDELDDLLFYLRHNILQITSGVTEYDDDNLEEVFNENAKLKIKINKAIEEINYMITNADITEISAIKLKQILGDKEKEIKNERRNNKN